MFVTVTVKMEATSKQQLVETFGDDVQSVKGHFDALHKEGVFGDPNTVEMRYLVIGGGFREVPVSAEIQS